MIVLSPNRKRPPALTLMDTVLAIAVIAVTLPLLLATGVAALEDRRHAEGETRATWLANELAGEIRGRWADPPKPGQLPPGLVTEFPAIASGDAPLILLFDSQRRFLNTGSPAEVEQGSRQSGAAFLVRLHALPVQPANLRSPMPRLARLAIQVDYPAAAPLLKRRSHAFAALLADDPLL